MLCCKFMHMKHFDLPRSHAQLSPHGDLRWGRSPEVPLSQRRRSSTGAQDALQLLKAKSLELTDFFKTFLCSLQVMTAKKSPLSEDTVVVHSVCPKHRAMQKPHQVWLASKPSVPVPWRQGDGTASPSEPPATNSGRAWRGYQSQVDSFSPTMGS